MSKRTLAIKLEKYKLEVANSELITQRLIDHSKALYQRQISQDLHNNILSMLAGVRLIAESILNKVHSQDQLEKVVKMHKSIQSSYAVLSTYIDDLRFNKQSQVKNIEIFELESFMHEYLDAHEIDFIFNYQLDEGVKDVLPDDLSLNILAILREVMANTVKHANATFASLMIALKYDQLHFTYFDNGKGFSKNSSRGRGLNNIVNRVESLNGSIDVSSKVGTGTLVSITINLSI